MSVLDLPRFRDDEAARARLEAIVWPNGPVCPHCGEAGRIYALKGARTRPGLRKCGACRKQFTVTVGTVFESSHVLTESRFQLSRKDDVMGESDDNVSQHSMCTPQLVHQAPRNLVNNKDRTTRRDRRSH